MDKYIHVAFGVSDPSGDYCKYVATAIYSIVSNTHENVFIHILSDYSISAMNLKKFEEMSSKCGFKFEVINISVEKLKENYSKIYSSVGTFLRFAVNKIGVDKLIYLDSDILATCDIVDLWNINIEDYFAAAVLDSENTRKSYIRQKYYKKMEFDYRQYFNAGVIVFNCKKIGQEIDLFEMALDLMNQSNKFNFYDQDVLNKLFIGKVKFLPERFNHMIDSDTSTVVLMENAINHYSGIVKPWSTINSSLIRVYFNYMKHTPWGNSIEEMIDNFSKFSVNQGKVHGFKWHIKYSSFPSFKFRALCFLKTVLPKRIDDTFFKILMDLRIWFRFSLFR